MIKNCRILVVTRGDYVTRLTLDPLLRHHPPENLYVIVVSGDSHGRTGLPLLQAMWRDYAWPYFVFELGQFFAFQGAQRLLPQTPFTVRALATHLKIPFTVTDKINTRRILDLARDWQPDILVSAKCTQRIRSALLSVPRRGAINVHGSLLPQYAGRAPHFWAMADGASEVGATVHKMTEIFDDGAIVSQKSIPLPSTQSVFTTILQVARLGGEALMEALPAVLHGTPGDPQDINQRSYFSSPTSEAVSRLRTRGSRLITIRQLFTAIRDEHRAEKVRRQTTPLPSQPMT